MGEETIHHIMVHLRLTAGLALLELSARGPHFVYIFVHLPLSNSISRSSAHDHTASRRIWFIDSVADDRVIDRMHE